MHDLKIGLGVHSYLRTIEIGSKLEVGVEQVFEKKGDVYTSIFILTLLRLIRLTDFKDYGTIKLGDYVQFLFPFFHIRSRLGVS